MKIAYLYLLLPFLMTASSIAQEIRGKLIMPEGISLVPERIEMRLRYTGPPLPRGEFRQWHNWGRNVKVRKDGSFSVSAHNPRTPEESKGGEYKLTCSQLGPRKFRAEAYLPEMVLDINGADLDLGEIKLKPNKAKDAPYDIRGRLVMPRNVEGRRLVPERTVVRLYVNNRISPSARLSTRVRRDGSFVFRNVGGGQFLVDASTNVKGWADREALTSPFMPVEVTDDVDLGDIPPRPVLDLEPGYPAPPIEIKGLDGKHISLKALRGKYVLVHFWRPFESGNLYDKYAVNRDGPGGISVPYQSVPYEQSALAELEEVYEDYGYRDNFEIIGLGETLYNEEDYKVRELAVEKKFKWPTASLGHRGLDDIRIFYGKGVNGPQTWLIGPDGKILVAGLKTTEIRKTLEKYLDAGN